MQCVDRAGDLREFEGKEGVDVGGSEEALVAIAGEAAVGVIGVGHVIAAAAAGIHTVVACRVVLSSESDPAWIICELADVADAEVKGAEVVVAAAAVIAGSGVDAASVVAVFVRCPACGVAAGAVAGFLQDLCLRLHDRVHIADFKA